MSIDYSYIDGIKAPESGNIIDDLKSGLAKPQKESYPKYLYDQKGAEIFTQICELEDYYPTRTEAEIFSNSRKEIMAALPENIDWVEFGAGSAEKIEPFIEATQGTTQFVPIDISREMLRDAATRVSEKFQRCHVIPVLADYTKHTPLPPSPEETNRVAFFPGSTIGNFKPSAASDFLRTIRKGVGDKSQLLIGVDLQKDKAIIETAYNDSEGLTAKFNLNLLTRFNREAKSNFDTTAFRHQAIYNEQENRIEMHLMSTKNQSVTVDNVSFDFRENETIFTESSYKHQPNQFIEATESCGWCHQKTWTDPKEYFGVFLFKAA